MSASMMLFTPENERSYRGPLAVVEPEPVLDPAAGPDADTDRPSGESEPRVSPPAVHPVPAPPGGSGRQVAPAEVRTITVTTEALRDASDEDIHRFAGGRAVVEGQSMRRQGATSIAEGLEREAGVRAANGTTGLGSGVGVLSLAVRGVNPRYSDRTTVLLDEVPVAMAPYGQPQLSLFPISVFSVDRVDVVRGGASVRFGPRTGGGVFNLVSRPIPVVPTLSFFGQVDQFGEAQLGTAYGATHGKVGIGIEYTPSIGRTFREHSGFHMQSGMVKLDAALRPNVDLGSMTHGSWQENDLPGGLSPSEYEQDPFQSLRPHDERNGWRVGEALKLRWRPSARQELQTVGYYNHTLRTTTLFDRMSASLIHQPRTFDAMGFEPRYTIRLGRDHRVFSDLAVGGRVAYELADVDQVTIGNFETPMPDRPTRAHWDARLAAYSVFVDDELYLFDEQLRLTAGVRLEYIRMGRRDYALTVFRQDLGALPAASLWFGPFSQVAFFVWYGRSFTPPDFIEITQQDVADQLDPEIIDAVDAGMKLRDIAGLWLDPTVWFKNFHELRDVGLLAPELIGDAFAWGAEVELGWAPGDLWDVFGGSEISVGYAWTDTRIYRGRDVTYRDKKLPWYPEHEVWGAVSYELPWGCSLSRRIPSPEDCRALTVGVDGGWTSKQFTEFTNSTIEGPFGASGPIAHYWLMDAFLTWQAVLPEYWRLDVTVGMKNLFDRRWYERSDDINGGRITQQPRTFYVNLGLAHSFVRAWERAQMRREARASRITSNRSRRERGVRW